MSSASAGKYCMPTPNPPAAGKAGIARPLAIEHYCPGQPVRAVWRSDTMAQNVPAELRTSINRQVLAHVEDLSAHSDIVEALGAAVKPLGDVQFFCPDIQEYRYVVASTKGVIIALAVGMNTIGFRLDERMKARALDRKSTRLNSSHGYIS